MPSTKARKDLGLQMNKKKGNDWITIIALGGAMVMIILMSQMFA